MPPSKKAKVVRKVANNSTNGNDDSGKESDYSAEDCENIINGGYSQDEEEVTHDPPNDDDINNGAGSLATDSLPRAPELPTDVIEKIMRSECMKPADIINMALTFNCGLDKTSLRKILMDNRWTKFQLFLAWLKAPPCWMKTNFGLTTIPTPLRLALNVNYIGKICFTLGGHNEKRYMLSREDYASVFEITNGFENCSVKPDTTNRLHGIKDFINPDYDHISREYLSFQNFPLFSVARENNPMFSAWRQRKGRQLTNDSVSLERFLGKVNKKLNEKLPKKVEGVLDKIFANRAACLLRAGPKVQQIDSHIGSEDDSDSDLEYTEADRIADEERNERLKEACNYFYTNFRKAFEHWGKSEHPEL